MENLDRYDFDGDDCGHIFGMKLTSDGDWVKFSDIVEALKPSHNISRGATALLRELFYWRMPTGLRIDDFLSDAAPDIWKKIYELLEVPQHPC
jgi:hypothetical protein